MPASGRVIPEILRLHFEELDFLWEQRGTLIDSPASNLHDLARLEERVEAHLDALRIDGEHTVGLALPALTSEESGEAAAATLACMASGDERAARAVIAALSGGEEGTRDGIRGALRHCEIGRIEAELREVASVGDAGVRAVVVDVLAFHRLPAPPGLLELLGSERDEVRRRSIEAAGRFGGPWSRDFLESALASGDARLAAAALEASTRVGLPLVSEICRRAVKTARHPEALRYLGVLGDPRDLALLVDSLAESARATHAARGLGAMGRVEAVEPLLAALETPNFAEASYAAIRRITGAVDHRPAAAYASPPDPRTARERWESTRSRFVPGRRWQEGVDVTDLPPAQLSPELSLRVRRDLYFSSVAADRALGSFEPEATARTQELASRPQVTDITRPGRR